MSAFEWHRCLKERCAQWCKKWSTKNKEQIQMWTVRSLVCSDRRLNAQIKIELNINREKSTRQMSHLMIASSWLRNPFSRTELHDWKLFRKSRSKNISSKDTIFKWSAYLPNGGNLNATVVNGGYTLSFLKGRNCHTTYIHQHGQIFWQVIYP